MKNLACLFAVLSVAACTDDNGSSPTTLTYDAYFIANFAPHASPEACIANAPDPRGCRFAITLCKNGRAAQRVADIISEGTYDMIGSVAHATFTDGTSLEFDVQTRVKDGDGANTTWIVDATNLHETQEFDTISCAN
jgi:hypothetical protein